MLAFMSQALSGLFTIVFVVSIGFILGKRGWFDEKSSALIAKLVTTVSLPLYMLVSLTKNFSAESLINMAPDMALPIISMILAMLIGNIMAKSLSVEKSRSGIFITNFFIANTMFIGLPVNLALFGDVSIPSVILYYVVNLVFFWTFGVHNIISSTNGIHNNTFSKNVLNKLLSPPLMSFILSIFLIFGEIQIPTFLLKGFQYVGNLTTPLSLIFIGIEISRIKLASFKFEKDILVALIGRFIVCPLCVLAVVPVMMVSEISVKVFVTQAAMPAMTQMAIVAKQYGADSHFASTLSFITILLGLIVIPIYMVILSLYF